MGAPQSKMLIALSQDEFPESCDLELADYLSGQSFAGSNIALDLYYVSGTVPFGVTTPPTNTWVHIEESGSYTVENIGQNFVGRIANITLDSSVDMPMKAPSTIGENLAGADFTLNGTVARSGRGPEQDNCVASEFDGSDYLSAGPAFASKRVTFSANVSVGTSNNYIFADTGDRIEITALTNGQVRAEFKTAAATVVYLASERIGVFGNFHLDISFDLTDTLKRHFLIDGVEQDPTYTTYTNDTISSIGTTSYIGLSAGTIKAKGTIGEVYLDTVYTDLASNNPFWDSDVDKPNPVSKVIADTAITPLIAIPLIGNDAGNNLGTGGDFTVNSGPFVGARGASEFWARGAVVDGSNYLTGSIYCESLVKWKSTDSGVTWTPTYLNATTVTDIGNGTDDGVVAYYWGTSEDINWALEENLLRVTDGLGYPTDIDNLLKYNANSVLALDFSDITDFGYNKAGADFIETGTIVGGKDVTV